MKTQDITGKKFNRLLVIKNTGSNGRRIIWECLCDCGKTIYVPGYYLTSNNTKSCGCLKKEKFEKRNFKHGYANRSGKKREYIIWQHIKSRCYNPNSEFYYRYGGRGIKMSKKWADNFINFYNDMGDRPTNKHTIERNNNNGNYTKSNCRWALMTEQSNNKKGNVFITYNNQKKTISQWARIYNLGPITLRYRIFVAKWNIEKSLLTPVSFNNKKLNLSTK